ITKRPAATIRKVRIVAQVSSLPWAVLLSGTAFIGIGIMGYWDPKAAGYADKLRFFAIMTLPVLLLPLTVLSLWRPRKFAPGVAILSVCYPFIIGVAAESRLLLAGWIWVGAVHLAVTVWLWASNRVH